MRRRIPLEKAENLFILWKLPQYQNNIEDQYKKDRLKSYWRG